MEKVAGFDSYVVGPADSKNVLVCVYDIFGFWDTTKQCADLLSESMKIKVVMPDLLCGKPWPLTSFPSEQRGGEQEVSRVVLDGGQRP